MSNYFQTLNRLERDRSDSFGAEELRSSEETSIPVDDANDHAVAPTDAARLASRPATEGLRRRSRQPDHSLADTCLLYTSDAADE